MLRKTLERALEHSLDHLDGLDRTPVGATADVHTLRRQLQRPLNEEGLPAEQVIDELVDAVKGGILGSAGGRFFGWVIGGATPASLAADWLVSAWDQNAALYACGPAAAIAEEVAGAWLKDLLGLPAGASFGLVTGCQGAHTTCLAAARHRVLANVGWDVEERGLAGSPVIRVLAGEHGHHTLERAMRLLGLGRANLHPVAIDDRGRLLADALEEALSLRPMGPTIVVLQAGDINIGAYDDFDQLIPLARKYGAWVHVDGAFGLWAAASPRLRHLVKGVEQANSWATDGHKWLNVPLRLRLRIRCRSGSAPGFFVSPCALFNS